MIKNTDEIIVPEVPRVIPGQETFVYAPNATLTKPGLIAISQLPLVIKHTVNFDKTYQEVCGVFADGTELSLPISFNRLPESTEKFLTLGVTTDNMTIAFMGEVRTATSDEVKFKILDIVTGPQGPQGLQGPTGPQGKSGVGISKITTGTVVQTDGYTVTTVIVTKTDGSTDAISIKAKNGEVGNVQELVDEAVAKLVDSAPSTLDTLNELAAALGNDPNFATTITVTLGNIQTQVAAVNSRIDKEVGEIETAIDEIIEIQDTLIGVGSLPSAETVEF